MHDALADVGSRQLTWHLAPGLSLCEVSVAIIMPASGCVVTLSFRFKRASVGRGGHYCDAVYIACSGRPDRAVSISR
jgi:hypothetical protein